jgi:putative transposase
MARLPRLCLPGISRHIMQRGNNRQACFATKKDFSVYAHWLEELSTKYHIAVHAWVMHDQSCSPACHTNWHRGCF